MQMYGLFPFLLFFLFCWRRKDVCPHYTHDISHVEISRSFNSAARKAIWMDYLLNLPSSLISKTRWQGISLYRTRCFFGLLCTSAALSSYPFEHSWMNIFAAIKMSYSDSTSFCWIDFTVQMLLQSDFLDIKSGFDIIFSSRCWMYSFLIVNGAKYSIKFFSVSYLYVASITILLTSWVCKRFVLEATDGKIDVVETAFFICIFKMFRMSAFIYDINTTYKCVASHSNHSKYFIRINAWFFLLLSRIYM